ncbi:hypothetical protein [Methylobacterium sp. AMS5]|uniref:hypothetical protein n=1 Tax=Methylobacterium sp. AMS5 TaxID=925818 RepID=UPI00074F9071|nr:hypothetical protein [Methylobacterium sp. AMS5]AMB48236.1 hypothetical protein Y590_25040 [Methylobacterium sp. AMS5]
MKTGRYSFENRQARIGWLFRSRSVVVLMVEHDEPLDAQGSRGLVWREATARDLAEYQELQRKRQVALEIAEAKIERMENRFESIEALAAGYAR